MNPAKLILPVCLLTPAQTAVDVIQEVQVDSVQAVPHRPPMNPSPTTHLLVPVVKKVQSKDIPVMAKPSFATSTFVADDVYRLRDEATQPIVRSYAKGMPEEFSLKAIREYVDQRLRVIDNDKHGSGTKTPKWSDRQPTPVSFRTVEEEVKIVHTIVESEHEVAISHPQSEETHDPKMMRGLKS